MNNFFKDGVAVIRRIQGDILRYIRIRWALGEKMIENNLAFGKSSDLNNNIDILYR